MIRKTFVYFVKPIGAEGPIKIGCSNHPPSRMAGLMIWSPVPLEVLVIIPGDLKLERNIHDCFADSHSHCEWFNATPKLIAAIARLREGVPVEQAIDLAARVGSIRSSSSEKRKAGWTPERRFQFGIMIRELAARKRARKAFDDFLAIAPRRD